MRAGHVFSSVIAVAAVSVPAVLGMQCAWATDADTKFLAVLEQLGVTFASEEQAVEAGNNICDIVAEGATNNIDPARIQTDLVQSLQAEGLAAAGAAVLMRGAVAAYCPTYQAVVGG